MSGPISPNSFPPSDPRHGGWGSMYSPHKRVSRRRPGGRSRRRSKSKSRRRSKSKSRRRSKSKSRRRSKSKSRRRSKSKSMKTSPIPKIVHQIWVGGPLPPILKLYTDDWKNMKGWDYRMWGNDDLNEDNFPLTLHLIKRILKLEKPVYAMIADLMRLEILYHHGGVYLDTTFEKVRNLTSLLDQPDYRYVMANEIPDPDLELPFISNSFIASIPRYIVLKRLLSKEKLSHVNIKGLANEQTGPYFVRSGIKKRSDVTLVPTRLIYPYDIQTYGERGASKCVSRYWKPGFKRYKFFNNTYYVEYPCTEFPYAYMIKQWDIGGTWIKK